MERKKIIFAVVVLTVGAAMWRGIGAMDQRRQVVVPDTYTFITSDNERVLIEKDKAILFETIKNLFQDAPEESEISLPLVSSAVLNKIIGDLDWVLAVRRDMLAGESENQAAKRIVGAMPRMTSTPNDLREAISCLEAVDYLNQSALEERCVQEIASMLASDAGFKLLQQNNAELIGLIRRIPEQFQRKIYKAMSAVWIEQFRLDTGLIDSAGFSPDGKRVITTTGNTATMWNATDGHRMHKMLGIMSDDSNRTVENQVMTVDFSLDGTRLLAVFGNGVAEIWDLGTLRTTTLEGDITSALFSLDGKMAVTTSPDGRVRIWNLRTNRVVQMIEDEGHSIVSAVFLAHSDKTPKIVTRSDTNLAKVWNVNTGECKYVVKSHILELMDDKTSTVKSVRLARYENRVVIVLSNGKVVIWDVDTDSIVRVIEDPIDRIKFAAFFRDGNKILTQSVTGMVEVWNLKNGQLLHALSGHANDQMPKSSRDGNKILMICSDGTVKVWDLITDRVSKLPTNAETRIKTAEFSPDGNRIVTVSTDGMAQDWMEIPTHNLRQTLYVSFLYWAAKNGQVVDGGLKQTVWNEPGRNILETFNRIERGLIQEVFSQVMQASNSNSNNSNN